MAFPLLSLALAAQSAAAPAPPLIRTTNPPPIITVPVSPQTVQIGVGGARARTNLASLVTADDYPAEAARAGEQGTTGFRLTVGPDGLVTDCTIVQSSGSAALDAASCRLMRGRARFDPAKDKAGVPTSDVVTARIAWRLPPRLIPDLVTTRYTLGADGVPRNCSLQARLGERVQSQSAPDCGPRPPSGPWVADLKKEAGGAVTNVRSEIRLIRDAAAPWPELEQTGRRVVAREMARLRVGAGGRVLGCVVLDRQSFSERAPKACGVGSQVSDYTAPGESEMRLVLFTAFESSSGTE